MPPISNPNSTGEIRFELDNDINGLYSIDKVEEVQKGNSLTGTPKFKIIKEQELTITTVNIDEQHIKSSTPSSKIELKLDGGTEGAITWSILDDGSTLDNTKKELLIDALVAKNEPEQWEKLKKALRSNLGNIKVDTAGTLLTIEIPDVEDYYLAEDQTILKVPYQLLSKAVNLKEQTFTIKPAQKALISGSATPTVSQMDIVKGGKTVVITLVNAKWDADIATDTAKREELLASLIWPDQTSVLKAKANVVRTNDKVVTITLPPIDGFKVSTDLDIKFTVSTDFY